LRDCRRCFLAGTGVWAIESITANCSDADLTNGSRYLPPSWRHRNSPSSHWINRKRFESDARATLSRRVWCWAIDIRSTGMSGAQWSSCQTAVRLWDRGPSDHQVPSSESSEKCSGWIEPLNIDLISFLIFNRI
jgi:hypothetical protein